MKKFIITVDTEGDNLWAWNSEMKITCENAKCISRFQGLCEKYNFKPVYLINYEMAQSDVLVDALKEGVANGNCEIGMHLHAWNTPPGYELPQLYNGCPYITEYPVNIIRDKHLFLTEFIEERFGVRPVSYRAGRWATNEDVFKVLDELGFKVDCSITPGITHTGNVGMSVAQGNNYMKTKSTPYRITENLIEIPMTTVKIRSFQGKNLKNKIARLIKGRDLWLRPALYSLAEMIQLIQHYEKGDAHYLEMMIHSSELLAGANPYCKNEKDIENMYKTMEDLFEYVSDKYEGIMLKDYYQEIVKDMDDIL